MFNNFIGLIRWRLFVAFFLTYLGGGIVSVISEHGGSPLLVFGIGVCTMFLAALSIYPELKDKE